ncbi:MAG TPA: energy-coupling factor transporter transmembrane component T [bacterium]|nr:energy-coupling factor transporter transmembrane component T [bacterium]
MAIEISFGQYLPLDSFIHRLDPRIKLIITLINIITIFIIKDFIGYIFLACFLLFLIVSSKVPPLYIFRGLKPLIFFILLTFFLHLFTTQGTVIFQWWILKGTAEGLRNGLLMVVRFMLLISFSTLLTLTCSPLELTDAMESLMSPLKRIGFPAHEMAMMMSIALRFIPVLVEETNRIIKAQVARGADIESGSIINRAKNLIPILVPLFVNTFKRADDLALAMEVRCYRGGEGRTRMKEYVLSSLDFLILSISIVIAIISILI